jgi:tRNA threonylcarbamoyladenosine biosynthesis protein TsaB
MILNIDTTTDICSVALSDGLAVLSLKETTTNTHAAQITLLIEAALKEVGKKMSDLEAVAISNGPGSYTSLRIGASTAKGICYALDIPLIVVDTLRSLVVGSLWMVAKSTNQQLPTNNDTIFCPMIDARRMEVYTALYDTQGNQNTETEAQIVDSESYQNLFEQGKTIVFTGNGAPKCKTTITHPNAIFVDCNCSAQWMVSLSYKAHQEKQYTDAAYYVPYYFKAPNITTPRLVIG